MTYISKALKEIIITFAGCIGFADTLIRRGSLTDEMAAQAKAMMGGAR